MSLSSRSRRGVLVSLLAAGLATAGACTTSSGPSGTTGPSFDSGASFDVTMDDASPEETGTDATSVPDQVAADGALAPDSGASLDSGSLDSTAALDAPIEAAPADAGHDAAVPAWSCLASVPYAAGSAPQAPVIVNLTHRALPDVAIVNHLDNTLYVYLNTQGGDAGVLQPAQPYPTGNGTNPHEVATADINGDGWADLATTSSSDFTVHINAADGTGTMVNAGSFDYGEPYGGDGLAFGDVNGDGRPDFVGTVLDDANVAVQLNQSTDAGVAWGLPVDFPVGTLPDSVTLGDLTGNHHLDMAVGNLTSQNASILFGDGGGGFTTQSTIPIGGPAGTESGSVAPFADLNGDGALDLILDSAGLGDSGVPGFLLLLNKNDGSGTFQPPVTFELANGGNVFATADMNGDGALDLVGIASSSMQVWVLLNQNDGHATFGAPIFCASGAMTNNLAAGDLDGNGKGDIVTTSSSGGLGLILGE
jgi:hypothetical protein